MEIRPPGQKAAQYSGPTALVLSIMRYGSRKVSTIDTYVSGLKLMTPGVKVFWVFLRFAEGCYLISHARVVFSCRY